MVTHRGPGSPQIGLADVDREALDVDGTQLTRLAEELGGALDTPSAADAPVDGWRVLRRYPAGNLVIGAPIDSTLTTWRLATYRPGEADAAVRVHPETMALRPSREERRSGLVLRWPAALTAQAEPEQFFIDIVNESESLWIPNGDGLHTVGVFTKPGVTDLDFGWASVGQDPACALGPGDYARISVRVDQGFWASAEPGEYELHAVVVDLGLRTSSPLPVDVSGEMIAHWTARVQQRRPTAEQRRTSLDARLRHLRTQLAAGNSLRALAEIASRAETDADALGEIRTLLDCDEATAESIYSLPLRELRPANAAVLENEIATMIRRRSSL